VLIDCAEARWSALGSLRPLQRKRRLLHQLNRLVVCIVSHISQPPTRQRKRRRRRRHHLTGAKISPVSPLTHAMQKNAIYNSAFSILNVSLNFGYIKQIFALWVKGELFYIFSEPHNRICIL